MVLGLGGRTSSRSSRRIGFSGLHGSCALDFALVFLVAVVEYVEPLAVYSVVHCLPYREFSCLERSAVVNLVNQIGTFQFIDLRATGSGCNGRIASTARGLDVDPEVITHDRPLLIGGRRLVLASCNRGH